MIIGQVRVALAQYYADELLQVLPSFVTDGHSMLAKAFRHLPDTACMEQNLNSVVCKPAHNQLIPIDGEANGRKGLNRLIKVGGYAYHGGGHLVQRVELSLDGGKTWKYCWRHLPDNPLRHGNKYWTWLFWDCEVTLQELVNAPELIVRAWDVFKNTQPEHITWNLTGMMNNAWYRVRPELETGSDGKSYVRFKHPLGPGATTDGWMKPSELEQVKAEATKPADDDEKQFTLEEIQKHDKEDDAWLIINNNVYDVTSVLSWHPGGKVRVTVPSCGQCLSETRRLQSSTTPARRRSTRQTITTPSMTGMPMDRGTSC